MIRRHVGICNITGFSIHNFSLWVISWIFGSAVERRFNHGTKNDKLKKTRRQTLGFNKMIYTFISSKAARLLSWYSPGVYTVSLSRLSWLSLTVVRLLRGYQKSSLSQSSIRNRFKFQLSAVSWFRFQLSVRQITF